MLLSSLILDVALTVMSIVCPLKFQCEVDGSCGIRMQIGISSGLDSVAMKSASDNASFSVGCAGGGPGGGAAIAGGMPGGGIGIPTGGGGGAMAGGAT